MKSDLASKYLIRVKELTAQRRIKSKKKNNNKKRFVR